MIAHVVMFKFYDSVTEEQRVEAEALLKATLTIIHAVDSFFVGRQINHTGKPGDWDLVELATFNTLEEINGERFRLHPEHVKMTEHFSKIADWVKVDAQKGWEG